MSGASIPHAVLFPFVCLVCFAMSVHGTAWTNKLLCYSNLVLFYSFLFTETG